jgi:hypothetical protein
MPRKWHPSKPNPAAVRAAVPLSETLSFLTYSCICGRPAEELGLWREHDEHDLPTESFVFIGNDHAACLKLMKDHPRLYAEEMGKPGMFPICGPCRHRRAHACRHPKLKANGGPGVLVQLRPLVPPNVIICPPPAGPKARATSCEGLKD